MGECRAGVYVATLAVVALAGIATMHQTSPGIVLVGAPTPQAANLAANLARYNLLHPTVFKAPMHRYAGPEEASQLAQARHAQPVLRSSVVPPGQVLKVLQPGQRLPPGAVVVNLPQLALPQMAQTLPNSRVVVGSMLPEEAAETTTGETTAETVGETVEEAVNATTPSREETIAAADVAPARVPNPDPFEEMREAMDRKKEALRERDAAERMKRQALMLQQGAVMLINRGWTKHEAAEEQLEVADEDEKKAESKVALADKLTSIATAEKDSAFAEQLKTIAEKFTQAAADKAADAEKWQTAAGAGETTTTTEEEAAPAA